MSKWRRSTRSGNQGNCVEWRKSSRSANQGDCVEFRSVADGFLVRDSKLGDTSPIFGVDSENFSALLDNLKQR
jgi:hypothetical protein